MDNKKLKKINTDLAAGHISEKEAELLKKEKKGDSDKPVQEKQVSKKKPKPNTRKRLTKSREVK